MSSQYEEILKDLKAVGVDFRTNDLDDSLEIKFKKLAWQRITDYLEAIYHTDMRELGYGSRKKPSFTAVRQATMKRAYEQRYNPIRDYFTSLKDKYKPGQNGPILIPTLSTYFTNPDGKFHDWLFKWMVGAIAKVFLGERNPMLVIVGPQKSGKSYFAQWITPEPIKDRFIKSSINPDSKDAHLRLTDIFIWEVEELGATTRRADIEALKAFITKHFIFERPPYGRHPIHKQANANFMGTVNYDGAGFLNDPTGSTRFLSCEVEKINWDYSQLDVNDLWSEAYWYFANVPDCYKLSTDEENDQALINEKFETVSALADVIETYFELTFAHDDFLTTQEIKDHCALHYRITSEQGFYNELGRVLKKLGLEKDNTIRPRGWRGLKKSTIRLYED